jgi:uncharacterized membrane protein YkgB
VNDGETRIYRAGESRSEQPDATHSISRDASRTEPAKLLAVFVLDTNDHAHQISLQTAFLSEAHSTEKRLQMTNFTNPTHLQIAEKGAGSLNSLALLRWALIVVFLWFGGMKFTAYEAAGIAPFIEHSPIMSWLHALFGVQGASYVIGVLELSTAAALILGAFQPFFSALGAAMSAATYLITLTFFLSTPGVAEATAGGFPAISAMPGQFLLKDLVLLAASLSLLLASVRDPRLNARKS